MTQYPYFSVSGKQGAVQYNEHILISSRKRVVPRLTFRADQYAAKAGFPTVIEATCNQVNPEGGYTGMTPSDFMTWLTGMADEAGVPMDQLILGGDHLGPNPWKYEPIEQAMEKACELVKL